MRCTSADIPGVVRKEVSRHTTDAMDAQYASPTRDEKREAVAKVYDFATTRRKERAGAASLRRGRR